LTEEHVFILQPGQWQGKGKISFNMSAEQLDFVTRWEVRHMEDGSIHCQQDIEITDVPDKMVNTFQISLTEKEKFSVNLSNEILGQVEGSGIIDPLVLAWEFRGNDLDFEGFEIFEKQEDKSYLTRAEFTSKDQMRTMIEGSIWQVKNTNEGN
jgi:hypothetical protein